MKIQYLFLVLFATFGITAAAQSKIIYDCVGPYFDVLVQSDADGRIEAVVSDDRNEKILGRYQIHLVDAPGYFEGERFNIFIREESVSPTHLGGDFSSPDIVPGPYGYGFMTCLAGKMIARPVTQPDPPPFHRGCNGGEDRGCI